MQRLKIFFKTQQEKQQSLLRAIENNNLTQIQQLLKAKTKPYFEIENGDTSLKIAFKTSNPAIVKLLLDASSLQEQKNMLNKAPVFFAIANDNLAILKVLLQYEIFRTDLNMRRRIPSNTPLEVYRVIRGQSWETRDLITFPQSRTPLEFAVEGNTKAMEILLEENGNGITNELGRNVLHTAVILDQIDSVKILLAKFPEMLYVADEDGYTPLHYAVCKLYNDQYQLFFDPECKKIAIEILKLLIAAKPNVNALSKRKYTALHLACFAAYPEMVEILIKAGADIFIKDDEGCLANEYKIDFDTRCDCLVSLSKIDMYEHIMNEHRKKLKENHEKIDKILNLYIYSRTIAQGLVQKESDLYHLSRHKSVIADSKIVNLLMDFAGISKKPLKEQKSEKNILEINESKTNLMGEPLHQEVSLFTAKPKTLRELTDKSSGVKKFKNF